MNIVPKTKLLMILSKEDQRRFFQNYIPVLYYSAVYQGLLPDGSPLSDFNLLSLNSKIQSRDALYNDKAILNYYRKDNSTNLPIANLAFLDNLEKAVFTDFIVLREYKKFVVLQDPDTGIFYQTTCITQPLGELLSYIPTLITTAIFNFNDRIICDGLLHGGRMHIGPNNEKVFLQEYRASKTARTVKTKL